jgi:DNA-directed RNA polymerase subunit RPC12/RpoP
MLWTCPRCTTRNPGPQKFCNGCGGPQPQDTAFEQAPEEKLVTDAAEIARAKAGPDIHCPYCNARNPGVAKFCGACGGDLAGGKSRESGKVVGAFRAGSAAPVACPRCGTSNPGAALKCSSCGASLAPPASPAPPAAVPARARAAGRSPLLIIGIILAALCGLGGLVLLLLGGRKSEAVAVVDSVDWERRIAIEALRPVEHEDWYDQVPSEAEVGICRQARRGTSQDPVANSVEVCGTPYTVDTGSGFGEVVQDCVYEVYDDLCAYTVAEWTVVDTAVARGTGVIPSWPSVSLAATERQGEESEVYSVVFVTDSDRYTYTPSNAAEFATFTPGSHWLLTVSGFGGITGIEPAP